MLKEKYVYSLFLAAFALVLLLPKPDARIERLGARITGENEVLIIGNSILDHQGPCEPGKPSIFTTIPEADVVGEGGLLLEEVLLASRNSENYRKVIIVGATYQLAQPYYYSIQNHLFYNKTSTFEGDVLQGGLAKKTLWRLDEDIYVDSKAINRGDASLEVKALFEQKRCAYNTDISTPITEKIFLHTYNYFEPHFDQISKLVDKFKGAQVTFVMVEPYVDRNLVGASNMGKFTEFNAQIEELAIDSLEVVVLSTGNDVQYYDEPWCLCGHLSQRGRQLLQAQLEEIVGDKRVEAN